jgi:2-polyprenyl-3-methyl-5-hydroxy-6-metoxy-1,4-benzoquinol methylase
MSVTIKLDPDNLSYNSEIYGDMTGMAPSSHDRRFSCWWAWAEQRGLNRAEYLLPQLRVATCLAPFSFEQRFVRDGLTAPPAGEIERLAPWAYQVEMGPVSTLGVRHAADWTYHRYRKSLLIDTISRIAGNNAATLSVLDVACHCGLFTLELAERGFGQVSGIDLREANINQARFLADVFGVRSAQFRTMNAREIGSLPPVDIAFCGGLLYHVTFPLDLLRDLFAITRQFLVLDSLCHNYALSAFHLVCGKNVGYSAEGETHYELHPTYRALCDGLYAVGFTKVFEIIGDLAGDIPHYAAGNVRSFVAAKDNTGLFGEFLVSVREECESFESVTRLGLNGSNHV